MVDYGNGHKLANRAILALFVISVVGIIGGIVVAYLGQPVGAIIAIVAGAVGGIVAIVQRVGGLNGRD
jgi:hypothetical protein